MKYPIRIAFRALIAACLLLLVGAKSSEGSCIDPSHPNTLYCFSAYETELQPYHYIQLDRIVSDVALSMKSKRPVSFIRIIGHAAYSFQCRL